MPRRNTPSNGARLTRADTSESQPAGLNHNGDQDDDAGHDTPAAAVATASGTTGTGFVPTGDRPATYAWNTPLEDVVEPESYLYEPQGELLKGSIASQTRMPSGPANLISKEDGEESRPSEVANTPYGSLDSPAIAIVGAKRKAGADGVGHTQQSSSKRPSRGQSSTQNDNPRPSMNEDQRRHQQVEDVSQLILPPRKVFPIQVGDKLFRLSGASISSDAPSYFSQFFEHQLHQSEEADNIRTLYIDRDPNTFEDIALHLKGYHIEPRDGAHYVKLFADAQFFSLPRLTAQLFAAPIYIKIGDTDFQIPRDVFNQPGDSPNYFTLGFSMFFTTPENVFPGLSQRALLRPPSILPPSVPQRSAKTFHDILHLLKGYPIEIRNEAHRAELLRDARYYHLKGLEQRLIPHHISQNLKDDSSEILLQLEDIRQSGILVVPDGSEQNLRVCYQRPYVDEKPHHLVVEIAGDESVMVLLPGHPHINPEWYTSPEPTRHQSGVAQTAAFAEFRWSTCDRMSKLISVVSNKMNVSADQAFGLLMMGQNGPASSTSNQSTKKMPLRIIVDLNTAITLDGESWAYHRESSDWDGSTWNLQRSQWDLRARRAERNGVMTAEILLYAVKIEAYRRPVARNASRGFLS